MKKIVLIITCILLFFEYTFAQENCGTVASAPPEWIFKPLTRTSSKTTDGYIIRIYVHLIQNKSGQGAKNNLVQECQQTLNRFFAHLRVQFEVIGFEIIYDDNYYLSMPNDEGLVLSKTNNHTNAIDIYVLPGINNWNKNGITFTTPSTSMIIKELGCYSSTIAHEMGHCLGLYHTHHGTFPEQDDDVNKCAELVDGSNSLTCGDYIEDTPADPNLWNECLYVGNKNNTQDINGQAYHPDPTNIMSYTQPYCRDHFTPGQEQRMRDFIVNTPGLINTLFKGFAISGYSYLDRSGTFTVTNIPAKAKVSWQCSSPDFIILTNSTNIVQAFASKYSGSGQLKATVYYNDILICELTKQITSSPLTIIGDTYLSAKEKRYKVNYIPYGGKLTWSYAPGITVKEKGADYIVITADKATDPWLRATVTASGTTTVKELKLHNETLTGASMEYLKAWRGTYDGQPCKKYAFRIHYSPATIPSEDLAFCWNNDVKITGPNSSQPEFILKPGKAKLITEGNIGLCTEFSRNDSAVYKPWSQANAMEYPLVVNPGGFDDDITPAIWERSVDYAVAIMPQINTNEESKGYLTCKVTDATGKQISVKSPVELFDKWQPVYHVSPNPAGSTLTVTRESDGTVQARSFATDSQDRITVNLFNDTGIVRSTSADGPTALQLDTSALPDGTYTLNVLENGKTVHSQVVIIKH